MAHLTDATAHLTRTLGPQVFSAQDWTHPDHPDALPDFIAEFIEFVPAPDRCKRPLAELRSWSLGAITFTRIVFPDASVRQRWHRPQFLMDDWCVTLTRNASSGQAALTLSTSFAQNTGCRSLVTPFVGSADGSEVLMLVLPRTLCESHVSDFHRARGLNIDPAIAVLLASYMDGLARQLPHIPGERAGRLAAATCSLVTACVAPTSDRAVAAARPVGSRLIERALMIVRDNMASPEFDSEQLCRLLAVSRSKLYRIFECRGGVARFINRERLRDAHCRLSDPASMQSIHAIAQDVGFEDHSTFSRAFRREFGCSPSEARARAFGRFPHADLCHAPGDGDATVACKQPP